MHVAVMVFILLATSVVAKSESNLDVRIEAYLLDADSHEQEENVDRSSRVPRPRAANDLLQSKGYSPRDVERFATELAAFNGPRQQGQIKLAKSILERIAGGDGGDWVELNFGPPHFLGRGDGFSVWIYALPFPFRIYIFLDTEQRVVAATYLKKMNSGTTEKIGTGHELSSGIENGTGAGSD